MTVTDKLLATLTAEQRVSAVFSAMARHDGAETARLMDTAPLATYKARDLEFWRLLHCAERMALHTALLIETEATHYAVVVGSFVQAVTRKDGCDPDEFDRLDARITEILGSAKAYWLAYAETCASIGLDPDELLQGAGVELTPHARLVIGKDVQPEPELLESARVLMQTLAGRE